VREIRARARRCLPPQGPSSIESLQLAAAAASLADQKKAVDIRVLEFGAHHSVADYLVIATGLSRPQVKALYNELHARLKAAGERHSRAEGTDLGWWILMDYGDVVVHLMQPEAREYYDLDGLYGESREVDWKRVELPPLPLPKARLRKLADDEAPVAAHDSRAAASD
jgi:ribosome-associated protein